LVRVQDGLEPLRKDFEAYVEKMGNISIEKITSTFEKEPRQYTETLMATHQKYHNMVEEIFNGDTGFHSSLDKACRRFVNKNAISTKTEKSPELLAKYSNVLLTKGRQFSEEQAEQKLAELLQLFRYVEDKDVFVTYYSHCFAKRCITDTSIIESEGSLISKLKGAYGVEYVSKLQKMYSDIIMNKDNKDNFKTYCDNNGKSLSVDCTARVLTVGSWPLKKPADGFTFSVPQDLVEPLRVFEDWYKSQKSGIELCWLHQYSRSELRFNVRSNDTYTFLLSDDFLLAILLKMNSTEEVTVGSLVESTRLQPNNFDPALKTLLKTKILLLNNAEFDDKAELVPTAIVSVNKKFNNKRKRLTVSTATSGKEKSTKGDATATNGSAGGLKDVESVDDQRKIHIQAAIVRIMKTRKELSHTNLTQETFTQLKNLFSPQPRMVKQCIQLLIEKDYLERKPDANDIYLYKA
jgi:cullin 1